MKKQPTEGRGVQSIEVGGRLLSAMVELARPAMLRDLAAMANVTSAQAHAYLVSFRKMGLVEQDAVSGRYMLGPFALQLGLSRMRSHVPLHMAARAAEDLAAETGLMVTISVWGSHGPTIIQVEESVQPIHVNLRAGTNYTVTGTATGRLFAALLPERMTKPLVDREISAAGRGRRIGTASSSRDVAADLAEIRARGYAVTEGVPVPGINAVSAPVFDHSGQVQFVITVIGPDEALAIDDASPQPAFVLAFAERLSANLGYRAEAIEADAPDGTIPLRRERSAGATRRGGGRA